MDTNNVNTHSGGPNNPIGKWLIKRKLRRLKLDAAQEEKVDTLFAIASSAHKDHVIVKSEVQDRFTEMMVENGYDREKAVEIMHSAADQYADRAIDITDVFADLYKTLAPWQQQQVLAMWKKRRHCRSHRCY